MGKLGSFGQIKLRKTRYCGCEVDLQRPYNKITSNFCPDHQIFAFFGYFDALLTKCQWTGFCLVLLTKRV